MTQITAALQYTFAALVAITILDTLGAVASRLLNFRLPSLAILSCAIYILLGYFISPNSGLSIALLAGLIVGFYDATVGWKLSKLCKANFGVSEEFIQKISASSNLKVMLFVAPLFTFIGHLIAKW